MVDMALMLGNPAAPAVVVAVDLSGSVAGSFVASVAVAAVVAFAEIPAAVPAIAVLAFVVMRLAAAYRIGRWRRLVR